MLAGKVCWGNVLDASLSGSREMSIQPAFVDSDSNREFPDNHSKIVCRLHLLGDIWGRRRGSKDDRQRQNWWLSG